MYKLGDQCEPAAEHRELHSVLSDTWMGRKSKSEGIYVYIELIHFAVQQKLTHHCKATVQFSSVTWCCLTLCEPMDCSTPGLPVHHQLLELTQTHVHWVCDAIQPSHPLSSPSPPTFNFSQHHSLFKESVLRIKWPNIGVSASSSVLPTNIHLGCFPLGWTRWISLLSKGLSRVFSNTTVQKHQFFSAQFSLKSNSHIHTWPLEKP